MPKKAVMAEQDIACTKCGNPFRPTVRALQKKFYWCGPCRHPNGQDRSTFQHGRDRQWKRWSREELDALIRGEIIEGRGSRSLKDKAWRLGIRYREGAWSKGEIAFLRRHYPDRGKPYCMFKLQRSKWSIVNKVRELGLSTINRRGLSKTKALSVEQRETLYETVDALVPKSIPPQIREEMVMSLILDTLDRKIQFSDLAGHVKEYRTKAYAMFPEKGAHASLDAQLYDDGPMTLGDTIESTAFRF
ncbi:hypothetical protein KBI52_10940 [Microvirga sp. HBU67558]|uniref:hypothetical protein n=1 Tax=Microvirga sp. HBU67558 TaxID=2824562 RepID=UPI001B3614B1|nr:hypothetical protein [Microvirga sp. HBU67558]MBQ0820721.1 hypothetical protein [Microvirga sp. HBU67558]